MTTSSRLAPPQALDLVSADRVRDLIAQTDSELSALERESHASMSAAERAEGTVKDAGLDPEASAWTMVRLQRFLDGLRDETQRDVDTILELARQQARFRIDDVGAAGRAQPTRAASVAPWRSAPIVDAPMPTEVAPSLGVSASSATVPPAASQPAPAPPAAPPTSSPDSTPPRASGPGNAQVAAAAVAVAAAPEALVIEPAVPHLSLVDDAPSDPALIRYAPPPVTVTPAPIAAPIVATPVVPVPMPTPAQSVPAPAPHVDQKKSRLRRLPISAILEVVAVLLVLIFILLRLS